MNRSLAAFIKSAAKAVVVAMLGIVPFQSLWLRLALKANVGDKVFFLLSTWYEFAMLLILAATVLGAFWLRFRLTKLDWAMLGIFVIAMASFLWSEHSLSYHIIGLRYSLLPVYAYFLTRIAGLRLDLVILWLVPIFWVVLGCGLVQILLWIAAPAAANMLELGIVHRVVVVPQVYGSLPGPNQLGTYLTIMAIVAYIAKPRYRDVLMTLAITLLVLTASRSAILGAATAFLCYGFLSQQTKRVVVAEGAVAGFAVAAGFGLNSFYQGNIWDLLTHGASNALHVQSFQLTWQKLVEEASWWQLLLGHGAGEAGPATFTRTTAFIPENWYLQTFYEYGAVGLLHILTAFGLALREGISRQQLMIVTVFVALLVNNLFLPTFSDNIVATSLGFILIALLPEHGMIETRHAKESLSA